MKIKIKKIKSLLNKPHPSSIEEGWEEIINTLPKSFNPPKVGERFMLTFFITSIVKKIIDDNTFKTKNSIYYWEILNNSKI